MIVYWYLINRFFLLLLVLYVVKIWGYLDIGLFNFLLEVNISKVK